MHTFFEAEQLSGSCTARRNVCAASPNWGGQLTSVTDCARDASRAPCVRLPSLEDPSRPMLKTSSIRESAPGCSMAGGCAFGGRSCSLCGACRPSISSFPMRSSPQLSRYVHRGLARPRTGSRDTFRGCSSPHSPPPLPVRTTRHSLPFCQGSREGPCVSASLEAPCCCRCTHP